MKLKIDELITNRQRAEKIIYLANVCELREKIIEEYKRKLQKAREALEYYATNNGWGEGVEAILDKGKKARETLKEIGE